MKAATALVTGTKAEPALAARAVTQALARAELDMAGQIFLYLSSDFARAPKAALLAAARAGGCMQVSGCTTSGLFTEEDWVLDVPAAAALVLPPRGSDPGPAAQAPDDTPDWRLTLAAPNAIDTAWLSEPAPRFGGISGDATGQGPYKVWQNGRLAQAGRIELPFPARDWQVALSRGVDILTPPQPARTEGLELLALGDHPALTHLTRHLPPDLEDDALIPLSRLMLGVLWGDPAAALAQDRYYFIAPVAADPERNSLTLAVDLPPGAQAFWALRTPDAAVQDLDRRLDRLAESLPEPPDFGLCFSCIGRGPYFYDGVDRDLDLITRRFPGLPLLGLYGNGEIAPIQGHNQLLQYSTVLALHLPQDGSAAQPTS